MTSEPDHNPLPLAASWLKEAQASGAHNPWAMALATSGADGRPACRYVLLKALDTTYGRAVFYTNYESRKARELDTTPRAAAALYWPGTGRQLRLEGAVIRSPDDESDAYFASRPRASQLNAWASEQSRPVPADGLEPALAALQQRFPEGSPVPRPPGWGGYRLWLDAIEFWTEGDARFHERIRYYRRLDIDTAASVTTGQWQHVRLQP